MKLSFQITNILAKTKPKKKEAPDPGEGSDQQQLELFKHIWLKARLIKQWKQYVLSNISKGTAFHRYDSLRRKIPVQT